MGWGVRGVEEWKAWMEAIRRAADMMFWDERYRVRARVSMHEMERYDPIRAMMENIKQVARGSLGR